MLDPSVTRGLTDAVGAAHVRTDPDTLARCSADALGIARAPDVVVAPGTTAEVAAVVRVCAAAGVPMVVRGAGTGYTGGAVPVAAGVVILMERFTRILEIDPVNLVAVVEPQVITRDLQRAVEALGLFYPPDPASLDRSSIGGNVAECAGGPRAFKYGTTKRYVLGLEAVLPTGEVIHTGSKAVKNVVGYDLTQLLVGSEGTLAIITEVTLRLVPKPSARAVLVASFAGVRAAVAAVTALVALRVVPAAIELVDDASLAALRAYRPSELVPPDAGALLIAEVDGTEASVAAEAAHVEAACRGEGATSVTRAASEADADAIWALRRELSYALRATGLTKINHDVVVPRGRVPDLMETVALLREELALAIACFGHAGDGNIHVNVMVPAGDTDARARAAQAEQRLFERVVELEGSISGEHGIGFTKARYLPLELGDAQVALMRRVKAAFDPKGLLNPGKIFPESHLAH
ncbi:MAG: FAD-linked oxidase C-terminal domain-containing protein [Vicinamibacterales bacterium]